MTRLNDNGRTGAPVGQAFSQRRVFNPPGERSSPSCAAYLP
ncbi:MAG TPA: hypothetical protein VKF41_01035 [Bryobacteraceae bacterium]|nr:hypothetical protein [Bryobacteraceae bacterium]